MKEKLFNSTASYNPTVWKPQDTIVKTAGHQNVDLGVLLL